MSRVPVLLSAVGTLVSVGTASVLLGCVGFVRWRAAGHLHREAQAPSAPVALVLGAQVHPSGIPSSFLAARLDLARRLFDAGRVQVLLLSGDGAAREYDEPAAMRRYLLDAGVPDERMVLDRFGLDTYDSCVRAAQVFGVDRVLVVTQSYHLPRAVGTARAVGLAAEGVGDVSVRRWRRAYLYGLLRDQLACVKTVVDLATHRRPVLAPPDTPVARASRS